MHIKWREVLDYKRDLLRCLSIGTGWPVAKLDAGALLPSSQWFARWCTSAAVVSVLCRA